MEIDSKIQEYLKKQSQGASVSEIARGLEITRATVSKYLEVLKSKGQLKHRFVGKAKVWSFLNTTKSVVVVSKEDNFVKLINYLLMQDGYRVNGVSDVGGLFRELSENIPELVLVRVEKEDNSYIDICKLIKKNTMTRDTKVLLIFNKKTPEEYDFAIKAGADDIISMPFDMTELREHLKMLVLPNEGCRDPITLLPTIHSARSFFNENRDQVSRGLLIRLEDAEKYNLTFGMAKFNDLLRLLAQFIKGQTVEFDKNCHLSQIAMNAFLVQCHELAEDEAVRLCNYLVDSFNDMLTYLSAYQCPPLKTSLLDIEKIKEVLG